MRNGGMEMLWTLTLPVSEKTADLDHWMEEYATPLLRLCTMILRDRQMAEEAVQDTLYRGYRGYAKFRGGSSEQTWLTRIAVNVCRDRLRRPDYRRERQGLPLSAAENQEDASRERPGAAGGGVFPAGPGPGGPAAAVLYGARGQGDRVCAVPVRKRGVRPPETGQGTAAADACIKRDRNEIRSGPFQPVKEARRRRTSLTG